MFSVVRTEAHAGIGRRRATIGGVQIIHVRRELVRRELEFVGFCSAQKWISIFIFALKCRKILLDCMYESLNVSPQSQALASVPSPGGGVRRR
jgi:hypothetical protein